MLRGYVKTHWSSNASSFKEPEVAEDEKLHIRSLITKGLSNPDDKLRTIAVSTLYQVNRRGKWAHNVKQ